MRTLNTFASTLFLVLAVSLPMLSPAQAHLMPAQRGTLNIVDDGAFMVLSLPILAFDGLDDDNNGEVSMVEFNNHRAAIVESVEENIILSDQQGILPLLGIMLSPVLPHDEKSASISQLTVLGRFSLNDPSVEMSFHIGLYGKNFDERSLEITASRDSDKLKQVVELSPKSPTSLIFQGE